MPAATLLLPYSEVDLDNPNGLTTLFSVNTASSTAVLTHVTVYSGLSVPVLDFNIYLTGYEVQTINLRDLLAGSIPVTASDGQYPADKISPGQDIAGCQLRELQRPVAAAVAAADLRPAPRPVTDRQGLAAF